MSIHLTHSFTKEDIQSLPAEQRQAIVAGLVGIVRADGHIDVSESAMLVRLLTSGAWADAGVTPDAASMYLHEANVRLSSVRSSSDLAALARVCAAALTNPALCEKLLWAMLSLAYADGMFQTKEQEFLGVFAQGLGVSAQRYELLVEAAADRSIHAAVARGRLAVVRALLAEGVSVDARDLNRWTPLHVAVVTGRAEAVDALLDAGADVHARHAQNSPPLFLACNKPLEAITERLLRAGARVTDTGNTRLTALHIAAMFGQTNTAKVLRLYGAPLDALDEFGKTPLHCAATGGHAEASRFLLSEGAVVDALTPKGCTPLHFAAVGGSVDCIEVLLSARASINALDIDGQTPLLYAASNNHPAALCLLLSKGANPNIASFQGVTPLHVAARGGYTTCARALLDAGAAVDPRNAEGGTPLFGAAIFDRKDAYDLLVSRGANPDAVTHFNTTPHGSIGQARAFKLRTVPLNASAPPLQPQHDDAALALERVLSAEPLSPEGALAAARFNDYQCAAWVNDDGTFEQVYVLGTNAHGRPEYAGVDRPGQNQDSRTRLMAVITPQKRCLLPLFTRESAAALFRKHTDCAWPEGGLGVAQAVMGGVDGGFFRGLSDLPIDGVILNPYGPGTPRVLSIEACDWIARRLPPR